MYFSAKYAHCNIEWYKQSMTILLLSRRQFDSIRLKSEFKIDEVLEHFKEVILEATSTVTPKSSKGVLFKEVYLPIILKPLGDKRQARIVATANQKYLKNFYYQSAVYMSLYP